MKVADFTPEQLKALIRESVEEALADFLGDPDSSLELQPGLKEELAASQTASIPAEEVIGRRRRAKQRFVDVFIKHPLGLTHFNPLTRDEAHAR